VGHHLLPDFGVLFVVAGVEGSVDGRDALLCDDANTLVDELAEDWQGYDNDARRRSFGRRSFGAAETDYESDEEADPRFHPDSPENSPPATRTPRLDTIHEVMKRMR